MNNTNYQQQTIEIDLKEVFWRLLSQWKAVLLASLAMAVLVCGAKYMLDIKAMNAEITARQELERQETLSPDERIEHLLEDLSDEERGSVEYAVREKEWLIKQKIYANNSVLMRTDPTNQRVLKQIYDIRAENKDDLSVLTSGYLIYMRSDKCLESLKPFIDADADNKYIEELLYGEVESKMEGYSAALEINITLPQDANVDAISDMLKAAFTGYRTELQPRYSHSVDFVKQEVVHIYHKENADRRTKVFNDINYMESVVKAVEGTLSAKGKETVDDILKIKEGERARKPAITEKADKGGIPEEGVISAPILSKKYAVLGFVLGAFLYAAAYVVLLALRGTVTSSLTVASFTRSRMLGEVYYDGKPEGVLKIFQSRIVDTYHYRGKTDAEMQIRIISESIDAICEHNGVKSLTVLSACNATEVVKKLKEGISAKGIDVAVVEVGEDFDEKSLIAVDNAVLAIGADTKISKLAQLMSLCADYDSNILGSMYLSSY